MEKTQTKVRILVFPWLAYSHVLPFLELAKALSKRNFHIYLCSSAVNLSSIKSKIEDPFSSIDLIQLHIPATPQLPPNLHTTKNLPPNLFPLLLEAFQNSLPSFSEILTNLKPDLLVYDFFQPWAAKLALSQGIPSIYFATSGAAPFSFYFHLFTYGTSSTFPYQEIYHKDHAKVDGPPPDKPLVKDGDQDFSFGNFRLSSEIVLVKSTRGVEGKFIDYLSQLCQKKLVPTGPLVQEPNGSRDEEQCVKALDWLSNKDDLSTVYICFGSEHFLSEDQILEIAKGLEICKEVNFLWVIKFDGFGLEDVMPEGFLERVEQEKRGMILHGWAPQNEILQHPSVGGFVSHCGWSSFMESMYFGVPMICMPMRYDQPINARLVVAVGAGLEIEKDENGRFSGGEVAKSIRKVFVENAGRCGARKMSEKIKDEQGESMDELVREITYLCNKLRD